MIANPIYDGAEIIACVRLADMASILSQTSKDLSEHHPDVASRLQKASSAMLDIVHQLSERVAQRRVKASELETKYSGEGK